MHRPADAEQPTLVAVDDGLEGAWVACPGHGNQAIVTLKF
jgi:hypothetical protein